MARIEWSEIAVADVDRIAEYIALDDPVAAKNLVNSILDQVGLLANFPNMGQAIPLLKDTRYRELIVTFTRVIYRTMDGATYIIRVIRFEQRYNIASLLIE
jgi:toxin ParE1/3/4